jgi:hypothetical protein
MMERRVIKAEELFADCTPIERLIATSCDQFDGEKDESRDFVRRLRAGEKFPYCGITPRGTIALLIS